MLFRTNKTKSVKPNNRHKFVFSKFISSTIAFGVLHTSLICCVLIQYFKDSGMLPLQLSIIITSKRLLRLFCDTFFGLIFDRFGAKIVFISGRLMKLISYLILLFYPSFVGFIIAMLFDGASYSSIYGKISSYIYNNLSIKRKLKLFPRSMSLYYLCMNATISMMTFFAGILLKHYGYNIIIYLSILTNIFSIFLLIRFVPKKTNSFISKYQSDSFKKIFLSLKNVIQQKPQFLYLIAIYGIVSFLAWQFHSISSLILLDMGVSNVELAMCGSILKLCMGIGAIISITFFSKGARLSSCAVFLIFILLFGTASAIIYSKYLFYIFCLLIVISYTTIEVSIEKNFEFFSDKKIRGTAISLAMTFCSLVAIFSNIIIGIIAEMFGYQSALICVISIITISMIILTIKLFKKNL